MFKLSGNRLLGLGVLITAAALIVWSSTARPVLGHSAEQSGSTGPAHYTVVLTEGHNLLVTDNSTNKLYFYTTDKDKPVGAPLKLRASLDLNKVGDPEIQITDVNVEKVDK